VGPNDAEPSREEICRAIVIVAVIIISIVIVCIVRSEFLPESGDAGLGRAQLILPGK
jgi:hypothetical protein